MASCLGIDIGGTCIKWALFSRESDIIERGELPTAFNGCDEVVDAISSIGRAHAGCFGTIGVSAPGLVAAGDRDGTIHYGGALPYMDGCPVGRILRERFDVPVSVNNDGKCCAMGEYAAGALAGAHVGVVLAIGTGIGGGIVIEGNVLNGTHCASGEFSGLRNNVEEPIDSENAFAAQCGWLGLRSLILAEKGLEENPAYADVDGRKLFAWIEAGDEAALRGLRRYARIFAGHLFNLQSILDPDVFAIAGGISCRPELIQAISSEVTRQHADYLGPLAVVSAPRVVRARLGNDANLYGAMRQATKLIEGDPSALDT
ncbi:ROK family protein [Coriobacterium glomerans PW2]|uniref:ROK family protein n=1 Tax=Coriobacterium glomerans (strain ATCC 49209 / DSM 20642 / JCM 10262 / PW2) TaxID=700015 RepID=F2N9A9_CORGP|nr:ROK family protein [Coriobacterium glomerans]AEB07857.1 ROK family protein [Coriobacterium glomerans PW2]